MNTTQTRLINLKTKNIKMDFNKIPTQEVENEIILESLPVIEMSNDSWFLEDGWFKSHPEKVLGEPYETSGRFGKVTKYKGTIDSVERIDVSIATPEFNLGENKPLQSEGSAYVQSAELINPINQEFIKKAIETSHKNAGKKAIDKKHKAVVEGDDIVFKDVELQTFSDVYRTYNQGITLDELEVYIWYKTQIGKPLSKQWVNLLTPNKYTDNLIDTVSYNVSEEKISEWVNSGLLFYYENGLVPAVEYLSGNMYDKKMQLDRDKDEIIAKYSEDVYNKQVEAFNTAWRSVYDKRLTIGQSEDSLVILPISKLASEFKINRLASMPEDGGFKIKLVSAASNKDYGRPDWAKDDEVSQWKKENVESLSLLDAFNFFLLKSRPELKLPITHLDIVNYYCLGKKMQISSKDDSAAAIKEAEARKEKLKSNTQIEGQRLFKFFLDTELEPNDKIRLETEWNSNYNNFKQIDLNKVPVAFNMCRKYKGTFEKLLPEKREAVAFTMHTGSGIISYDVGVGKTPSAIFTMSAFIDAGYAKRICLTVPNQVYKQFISEIRSFAPHIPIIEGYNLSPDYLPNFQNSKGEMENVPSGSITVLTYEGLERVGFNEYTQNEMISGLYEILNQGGESERVVSSKESAKKTASFYEKIETLVGKGLSGTTFNIEDFGFDFMCYDEAHKMKKVFTAVKGEVEEDGKGKQSRGRNPYQINSGTPSSIGLKGFMLNYYVQQKNKGGNVLMLTATPFTNSPLEIFSMLSMVGYDKLKDTNLNNIKTFFDTYVNASTQLVINSKLKPQFKQVILGFNNLISLQTLIRRFINYKTGEEVNVQRPKKYVLPYLSENIDGIVTRLGENEKVETFIPMTPLQERMMESIISYVEGNGDIDETGFTEENDVEQEDKEVETGIEVDEDSLSSEEKTGVRIIKGLTYSRNLALSPHLFVLSGLGKPDYKSYVEMSPKLKYVMGCVKSVRDYHIKHKEPISGQVIYMDRGIEYFGLLKEYLIKECGFAEHEVGIIKSGLPKNGKRSKEYIKNLFNGEVYNEVSKLFDTVADEERIKVVIGSSTIKEGINLQKFGTVLYNCFIDWNPTDIQQLEGRIWRQGNEFKSVRIVNPLVIDSADIFLFQKLQEKTSRLNTIWATDGKKNVLNTEEFNPEELKYALIRDPKVIAELKSIEGKAQIESELLGFNRQLEQLEKLKENAAEINSHFKSAVESIQKYRDVEYTSDKLADAGALVKAIIETEKSQKDKEGKKMVSSYERDPNKKPYESWTEYQERKENIKNLSSLEKYYKPYWFSDFSLAVRDTNRMVKTFVNQYEISFSLDDFGGLDYFKSSVEKNIEEAKERQKYFESDEYKKEVIEKEIQKRIENQLEYKPLQQTIFDFGKLNYLLSEKKVSSKFKITYPSCPPMDANGVALIDKNAIAYLTECIERQGQTKDLYFNEATKTYTPERQALHDEIIGNLFKEVKCVKQGKPIAVFTGGSPASGKSYFVNKIATYLTDESIFHLDADAIREKLLPEYQGWNASATHKETQDIVNSILEHIGEGSCRYDFLYDGTMNKAEKYFPLINKVKSLGYETYIIFLDIPYAVAYNRSLQRYQNGFKDGKMGRYVPVEVIEDFFRIRPNSGGKTMGQYALDELKTMVDGYIVVDGLTGNVIEKKGDAFPRDRDYENKTVVPLIENLKQQDTLLGTKQTEMVSNVPKKVQETKEDEQIFNLWKEYATKYPNQRDNPNYISFVAQKGLPESVVDALYAFNFKYVDFNSNLKYNANSVDELENMAVADKTNLKETLPEREFIVNKLIGKNEKQTIKVHQPTKVESIADTKPNKVGRKAKETKAAEPTQQQIKETIEGLMVLADMGDEDAMATAEGLKLLLD
jgi:dephospho-CoA kinase